MKDERKHHGEVYKRSSAQQFHKSVVVIFLSEKTRAVALVQLGLTAGRQRFLELYTGQNIRNLMAFRKVHCHYSSTNTF